MFCLTKPLDYKGRELSKARLKKAREAIDESDNNRMVNNLVLCLRIKKDRERSQRQMKQMIISSGIVGDNLVVLKRLTIHPSKIEREKKCQ